MSRWSNPSSGLLQSVVIDDGSARKLHALMVQQSVVVNIPFILIGLGVLLGVVFVAVVCRQKGPEVTNCLNSQ